MKRCLENLQIDKSQQGTNVVKRFVIIELRLKGGGIMVSMLAFNSDDPSLNPGEVYSFLLFISVRNEQK